MFKRISARVKRVAAAVALLSMEMAVVVGLFVCALIVFVIVTRRVFVLGNTGFDLKVFRFLQTHVSERNNEVVKLITFLGSHEFLIPANLSLITYFLFIRKHKWYSIKVPAIALSSLALMFVLKQLFNRPRPAIPLLHEAKGMSFPSGHALMSVTFFGLLIYIIFKTVRNKELKWGLISLLIVLILLIGFTRIYLRVHYFTDVVAGYCIGFLWLVFAVWLLNKVERNSRRKLAAAVALDHSEEGKESTVSL